MFDWNDLKFFLAVARGGSTGAAARLLNTSQSTVQRRLAALEERVGHAIVQRNPTGYRLTAAGRQLVPYAEAVEAATLAFERHVAESTRDRVGVIRVTCPEPMGHRISQSSLLARFHERHPRLRVELLLADRFFDISAGEADIAIRSGQSGDDTLVARKIGSAIWAVYASRSYIARRGQPGTIDDLNDHSIVSYDKALECHRAGRWIEEVAPRAKVVTRNDTVLGAIRSVRSGAGIAPLPLVLAEEEADLVRVLGPIRELTRDWQMLTRRDLRHTPRIGAFFDFVVSEIGEMRRILMEVRRLAPDLSLSEPEPEPAAPRLERV